MDHLQGNILERGGEASPSSGTQKVQYRHMAPIVYNSSINCNVITRNRSCQFSSVMYWMWKVVGITKAYEEDSSDSKNWALRSHRMV